MDFKPFRYALGTVTIWHGATLVAIIAVAACTQYSGNAGSSGPVALFPGLLLLTLAIVWMYLLAATVIGQLVGNKYSFAQVWPSALVLGCLMAVDFMIFALASDGKPVTLKLIGFGIFAVAFFSAGITLFLRLAYYLMPRVGEFVAYPEMSWGMHL